MEKKYFKKNALIDDCYRDLNEFSKPNSFYFEEVREAVKKLLKRRNIYLILIPKDIVLCVTYI